MVDGKRFRNARAAAASCALQSAGPRHLGAARGRYVALMRMLRLGAGRQPALPYTFSRRDIVVRTVLMLVPTCIMFQRFTNVYHLKRVP